MASWKQAWTLAKFELKQSKRSFLFLIASLLLIRYFLRDALISYLEREFNYTGLDILFLLIFSIFWLVTRRRDFKEKSINSHIITPYSNIYLRQLPITIEAIAKRNMLIALIYTVPCYLIMLVLMYTTIPEFKTILSPGSFIVFSSIWLGFGLSIGLFLIIYETTHYYRRPLIITFTFCLGFATIIVLSTLIAITGHGIVGWTIHFANHAPVISTILSITIAIISLYNLPRLIKKRLNSFDYL